MKPVTAYRKQIELERCSELERFLKVNVQDQTYAPFYKLKQEIIEAFKTGPKRIVIF